MNKLCKVDGCDRDAKTREMCVKHYQRAVYQGVIFTIPKSTKRTCSVYRCVEPIRAKTLCNKHYKKQLRGVPVYEGKPAYCTFEGCEKPHKGKGFCTGHLAQLNRGQVLSPLIAKRPGMPKEFKPCSVEGCDREFSAKGLCRLHYDRKLRTGSVELKLKFVPEHALEDTEDLLDFGVYNPEELARRGGWYNVEHMFANLPEELRKRINKFKDQ